jgi:hypothetical protein
VLSVGALALVAANAVLAVDAPVVVAAFAALALVPLFGAVVDRTGLRARLLGSDSAAGDHSEKRRPGRPERAD